jgi:large subunit ribosomal protein L5
MGYTPRLRQIYDEETVPGLREEFSYHNPMAAPRLNKIVINIGVGEASRDPKLLDEANEQLTLIAGQKPVIRRARKSVSNFKLREGMAIGVMVTLRGNRMWEFLDRLTNMALPRVRDFRGVSGRAFDGRGNFTLGIKDQLIYPEVSPAKVNRAIGMNVTIVTSARTDAEAKSLLKRLGMPFAN